MQLKPSSALIQDGESNDIHTNVVYRVGGGQFLPSIDEVYKNHGSTVNLLPISAGSAGGGVFQQPSDHGADIVGIQFIPSASPKCFLASNIDITSVALDQIVIDVDAQKIYAGSGVTLEQLNQALAEYVGEKFKVLGADLTSYTYAQVGSTFMTGGMGPQRRYFSDSVQQVALFNGIEIEKLDEHVLAGYAGTYGWTGIVTAVCCEYCELPKNEITFAMPVSNDPESLARLLAHFSGHCFLRVSNGKLLTGSGGFDCILGIEHITANAMGPMLADGGDTPIQRRAKQLQKKCELADADGLVFINGRSNQDIEHFLWNLIDSPESDTPTISGMALEHTEVFNVGDEMRAVREAVPAAARGQAPKGKYSFKGHTDANIRLNPECIYESMFALWEANEHYVSTVDQCFKHHPEIQGEILVYGHLNPYGVDPHNRITVAGDTQEACEQVKAEIAAHTQAFFRSLKQICEQTGSLFIGGEKGAASEFEIAEAFPDPDQLPVGMRHKLIEQRERIRQSSGQFKWRALPLYKS